MSNLVNDQAQFERLKLKLAIIRYSRKRPKDFARSIYLRLYCQSQELFDSVVEEMCAEGLFRKETGRNGALLLVRVEAMQEVSHA
jgi:hypothetical protein